MSTALKTDAGRRQPLIFASRFLPEFCGAVFGRCISSAQIERLKPYFPRSYGVPRVDDRRVLGGIIHVSKRGL
ncbi:MAG: hypothetical protein V3V13_13445 [Paracoccaceae bacterium]